MKSRVMSGRLGATLCVGALALAIGNAGHSRPPYTPEELADQQQALLVVVNHGRDLWRGSNPTMSSNGLACGNCHPDAAASNPQTFPKYQADVGRVIALREMINWCISTPQAGQTCDTHTYPLSAPSERFADNGDGTVTDRQSGLMWMRCALNQSGGYRHHEDWRMPHIPELAMIVERQCANPPVNLQIFPDTPAQYFWTATKRRGAGMEGEAYVLSFGAEGVGHPNQDEMHWARLVRSGK